MLIPPRDKGAMVDIELYREFLELARALSYRETATRLNISQSALSKHIKSLEAFYGVTLFDRDKQHVALTAEGGLLLEHAQQIWGDFERSREAIALSDEARPLVLSGLITSPNERSNVTLLMQYLAEKNISRRVRMKQPSNFYPDEQLRLLSDGAYDCFVSYNLADQIDESIPDIAVEHLRDIPLCIAIPPESPLASKDTIAPAELSGGTFAHLAGPHFTPSWHIIEGILLKKGIPFVSKPIPTDSEYDYLTLDLRNCILVLPWNGERSAAETSPNTKTILIDDPDFKFDLDAAYSKSDNSESLRCLLEGLHACYQPR